MADAAEGQGGVLELVTQRAILPLIKWPFIGNYFALILALLILDS